MRRLSLPVLAVATLISGPLLLSGQVTIERGNTFGPLNADTICLDAANRDACLSRAAANLLQLDAGDSLNLNPAGVRVSTDADGAITFLGLGNGSDEDFTINLDDTANTADFSSSTGLNTWTLTGLTTMNFGAAGVRLTQDEDGAITLLGLGNGADEDFTINLDDAANRVVLSSSTGVTQIDWAGNLNVSTSSPAANVQFTMSNTSGAASANGVLAEWTASGEDNTGDAQVHVQVKSGGASETSWSFGIDTSATRAFVVSQASALGTNNALAITTGLDATFGGDVAVPGRISHSTREAVTVDVVTTFAITSSYVLLACTGAETINTITGGLTGVMLIIEHTDADCTIADDDDPTAANAIDLTGAATSDIGAANKMIGLQYNGTYWMQAWESDN